MYFGMGVDCGSRTCGAVGLAERRTVGAVGAVGAGGAIGAVGLAEHRTVGAGCPLTLVVNVTMFILILCLCLFKPVVLIQKSEVC